MAKVPLAFFKKRPLTEFQREKIERSPTLIERIERVIEHVPMPQADTPDQVIQKINNSSGFIDDKKIFSMEYVLRQLVFIEQNLSYLRRAMTQGFSGVATPPAISSGGGSGTPATSVTSETSYGISPAVGTSTDYARADHTHGSPATPTKTTVGLANVDNTSDASKPVSTATQTALDLKANLASPTFTGTVAGITASMVGLGNVNNTSDANKPVSTAQQSALDLKLSIAGIVENEVVSGSGTTFTLANTPVAGSVKLFGAGQRLTSGAGKDFTISGGTITTVNSYSTGDLLADYRT